MRGSANIILQTEMEMTKHKQKMNKRRLNEEVFLGKSFVFKDRPCFPLSISIATEIYIEKHTGSVILFFFFFIMSLLLLLI